MKINSFLRYRLNFLFSQLFMLNNLPIFSNLSNQVILSGFRQFLKLLVIITEVLCHPTQRKNEDIGVDCEEHLEYWNELSETF